MFSCLHVTAQRNVNEINYFKVDKGIAKPVTIETNLGRYKIYGGEEIKGHITKCTPRDAHGNLIVNNQAYKTEWSTDGSKPTKKYWRFSDTYNEHSVDDDDERSSSSGGNDDNGSWGGDFANSMNKYAGRASEIECYGYPNFQFRVNWSLHFGEMITVKTEFHGKGGYIFAGGIGKQFDLIMPEKKLSWCFFTGYYSGSADGNDFSLLVGVGCNQVHGPIMVYTSIEYTHFLSVAPHVGFYLGAGAGIYVDNSLSTVGDVYAGLTYRLF